MNGTSIEGGNKRIEGNNQMNSEIIGGIMHMALGAVIRYKYKIKNKI